MAKAGYMPIGEPRVRDGVSKKRNPKTRTWLYLTPETEKGLRALALKNRRPYSAEADILLAYALDELDPGWRERL